MLFLIDESCHSKSTFPVLILIISVNSRPWCCGFVKLRNLPKETHHSPPRAVARIINIILCIYLASYTCTNLARNKTIIHTITERICKEDICGWAGTIRYPKIRLFPIAMFHIPFRENHPSGIRSVLTMQTNEENGRHKHGGATTFFIQVWVWVRPPYWADKT
jgi:hypothetical protein